MRFPHQLYVLKRAIEQYGQDAKIKREKNDSFGESSGQLETIASFRGLFHTSSLFLDLSHFEAGQKSLNNQPQFLILYRNDIKDKDLLYLEEKPYTITGIADLGNLHLCLDLSLKEGDHV